MKTYTFKFTITEGDDEREKAVQEARGMALEWKKTVRDIYDLMHSRKHGLFSEKGNITARAVIELIENGHNDYFCAGNEKKKMTTETKELDLDEVETAFKETQKRIDAEKFIIESNRIEGIIRKPDRMEIEEHLRFMTLKKITLEDMIKFVNVFQPGVELRDREGMNVRVGNHIPMAGGPDVRTRLKNIIKWMQMDNGNYMSPYKIHIEFEKLHPFTDCNGRAGRMLWLWMMKQAPLGFLHHWYYQSLSN